MTTRNTALVLGASGIIGRNLIEHLDQRESWRVKAVARRLPDFQTKAELRSLDLLDPAALAAETDWLKDVTTTTRRTTCARPRRGSAGAGPRCGRTSSSASRSATR